MAELKQSTTYTRMFMMIDSIDHITGKTGLTVTATLSKAGGAFAAAGGAVTEVSSGWYKIALNTTDTNTLGDLAYHMTATGADPTDFCDTVVANILGDTLPANVLQWNSTNVAAPATAGIPDVNVKNINNVSTASVTTINANQGTTQPLNFTGTGASALVKSDMVDIAGAAVSTASAQIGVNVINAAGTAWNSGAIGASTLAAGTITNAKFAAGAIDAAAIADAAIDRATFAADTGLQAIRSGTAQAGAAGTITLDAGASATDNFYNGVMVYLTGATGAGQVRVITAYVGATKVATIAPNWTTAPDATSTFALVAFANPSGIQGNVTGSVASVTGAVGSVTGNVGGNVTGSVGSVTGNVGGTTNGIIGTINVSTITASGFVDFQDGMRIFGTSLNRAGLDLIGTGAGPGLRSSGGSSSAGIAAIGGTTGIGIDISGGATSGAGVRITTTSGDGLSITPTAGHGLVLTGNGTSKHGAQITGGTAGTSDGLKAVAGTGGVPIRGDLTGNITGNVSGSVGSVTGAVGSVTGNVGGNVVGSVGSVTAGGLAQSDLDKVFGTSGATLTELSQALPPASPRPDQALMLLYMALRNASTTTSTTYTISNDAGTVITKSTLSDDGTTFTRAELVSGP